MSRFKLIIALALSAFLLFGCTEPRREEAPVIEKKEEPTMEADMFPTPTPEETQEPEAPTRKAAADLMARFGKKYVPIEPEFEPAIPPYELPLDEDGIGNFAYVMERLKPGDKVQALILKNGFAAKSWNGEDFVAAYESLRTSELPVYVTSDSVLHLYHIQFDETLKGIEQKEFIPKLTLLTRDMVGHLMKEMDQSDNQEQKAALEKAVAFLAVGCELLGDRSGEIETLKQYRNLVAKGYDHRYAIEAQSSELQNLVMNAPETRSPEARRALNQFDRRGDTRGGRAVAALIDKMIDRIEQEQVSLELPPRIREMVDADMKSALEHKGFVLSPIFSYKEDFSQYVPRGHYTRGYDLKRYFRAMMWFGRMTFLVKGGDPHGPLEKYLVSAKEARLQTMAAGYITKSLKDLSPGGEPAMNIWQRIYGVTSFFVGLADDLSCTDYDAAFHNALGENYEPAMLLDDEKFLKLKAEVARLRKPAIYSGSGESGTLDPDALKGKPSPELLEKTLAKTQGFRFMGQRFVPDSYVMGQLVFPTVNAYTGESPPEEVFTNEGGLRAFPRGLDVMALLGSKRAGKHLVDQGDSAYTGFADTFEKLEEEFASIADPEEWNINLYWSWLYCLKGLLENYPEGYQKYMTTPPWLDKQLNAALGSWSQLRHDTILYVKQSYTMLAASAVPRQPKEFPGYVEPVPRFYARLLALTRLTRKVLSDMNVLDDAADQRLKDTDKLLSRLMDISIREVENKPLDSDDERWIKHFDQSLKVACCGHDADAMKTTLIADVHTDQNSGMVLEEGTGRIGLLLVANRLPDGAIGLAAGPVFTYYEFKHPMSDRLTDEKWREMLRRSPDQLSGKKPRFIRSYFVEE